MNRYSSVDTSATVANSTFNYDTTGRLSRMEHRKASNSTLLAGYSYTWDNGNRLMQMTFLPNGAGGIPDYSGETVTYTYDDRNQVKIADRASTADDAFNYDNNGNRVGSQTSNGATTAYASTAGPNNRLENDYTYSYSYDAEENMVLRTNNFDGSYTVYDWDQRNRLIAVTNKTVGNVQTLRVTYDYDALGQLVKRTEQAASTAPVATGFFVHDGGQIVLELAATGAVQHRLLWGAAVDQALADEDGTNTTRWYLTDHLGTVRDVVNNAGTNVNHIQYDSFGRRITESGAALNDFDLGYTGKWFDRATGLQWNLHRWYNAAIGRWLSEDPIGFAAGDTNLGRYVGNQSTRYTDPSGLQDAGPGRNDDFYVPYRDQLMLSKEGRRFISRLNYLKAVLGEMILIGDAYLHRHNLEGYDIDPCAPQNGFPMKVYMDIADHMQYAFDNTDIGSVGLWGLSSMNNPFFRV